MKVSEISVEDLKDYCGIADDSAATVNLLNGFLIAGKEYIKAYCNLTEDELDQYEPLAIAIKMFVYDKFENRSAGSTAVIKENPAFSAILGLYNKNLL